MEIYLVLHIENGNLRITNDLQSGGDGKASIVFSETSNNSNAHARITYHGDDIGGDLNYLGFGLGDSVSKDQNLFVIQRSGDIGIGTTSPSAKLHVSSMTSGDAVVKIEADIDNNNESDNPIIQFRQDGGTLGINMGFDETLFGSNIFGISRLYSENQFNDCFFIDTKNGNVSIGKKPTSVAKLDIAGTIRATEIKVEAQTADFVFSDTYTLKDLGEVENFIKTHKHLPDIPSAEEMEASGVNLAEMNKLLLQKIEELTLYVIDLEKVNKLKDNKIKSEIGEREKLEEKVSSIYSELKAIKTLLLYNQNNAK